MWRTDGDDERSIGPLTIVCFIVSYYLDRSDRQNNNRRIKNKLKIQIIRVSNFDKNFAFNAFVRNSRRTTVCLCFKSWRHMGQMEQWTHSETLFSQKNRIFQLKFERFSKLLYFSSFLPD